jgi:hypothetical protein
MLLQSVLVRVALAVILVAAPLEIALAQTDPNTTFDKYCHDWGADLKKIAASATSDAQRASAIETADASLETQLKLVEIPGGTPNFTAVTGHLSSCLEREAKAAFGAGTTVTVKLSPRNIQSPAKGGGAQVVQSNIINGTIQVSPGSSVAAKTAPNAPAAPVSAGSTVAPAPAAVSLSLQQAYGKQWGDSCLSKDKSCCSASDRFSGTPDCKGKDGCKVSVKICETMVSCNTAQNDCRKKTMSPKCDNDACKKCVADYKSCHDAALRISN